MKNEHFKEFETLLIISLKANWPDHSYLPRYLQTPTTFKPWTSILLVAASAKFLSPARSSSAALVFIVLLNILHRRGYLLLLDLLLSRTHFSIVGRALDIRSVMKERRLKDLIILGSEKDLTDTIDLEKVVDRWAKQPKTQRLIRVK